MSEFVRFTPEGDPYFHISSNAGELYSLPDNSGIYKHGFENRGIDHLFVELVSDDEVGRGMFLFRVESDGLNPGMFDKLIGEMESYGWPVFESETVSECDQDVFNRFVDGQVKKVTNKKIRKALLDE